MKNLLHFFLFLITLWVSIISPAVESKCIPDQQLSLLKFKNSLVFNAFLSTKLFFWKSSTDCCSWGGVTCSADGRVLGLDISSEYVSGGIDNSSSLFHLPNLQSLNLAYNLLGNDSRSIPSAIGQLMNLRYLNLSWNAYTGQIPIEISRLTRLVVLDISSNYFYDRQLKLETPTLHMLIQNLTELRELYLDSVQISAQGSEWCQAISSSIPNLRVLSLSYCDLSGPFHHSLAKLQSTLSVMQLDGNNISAPVPRFFANFSYLTTLSLDDCGLQGTFPKEIFQLPSLQSIRLSNNPKLGGFLPEFSKNGPFHHSLAKLQSTLSVIQLDGNNFSGPVPRFFANFSNLTSLSLVHCGLQGTFPKEIFQLPSLQSIRLSNNPKLGGSLPEFSKNVSLHVLDISQTSFSGSLPNSIGSLEMLSTIYIQDCNFTGTIPKSMTNLTQLVSLRMSGNNFEGSVPSFSGAQNLEELDLSSNGLTGNISCNPWVNLTNLWSLDLSSNMLDGNIPSCLLSLSTLILSSNQFFGQFPEISNISSYFVQFLDLSSNSLEGEIPISFFNLRSLEFLFLSSNNFSGTFPLDGLQHLRNLDLSHNSLFLSHDATNISYSSFPQFQFLRLASLKLRTFPEFLRNQSDLLVLDLSVNQIQGKIPNWIWRFDKLVELNLSCNSLKTLEGPTINLTPIVLLDLHSNQLHGKIPISSALNLIYLDYSRNNFNSTIPTTIGDLLLITKFFSISSNNLSGIIPESLCKLRYLEVLNLSNNSLSGTVPHCLTTLSTLSVLDLRRNNLQNVDMLSHNCSLRTLDMSENQIQGQFLKSLVNCPQLEVLNLGKNQITGPFPCFLKNTFNLRVLVLRSNQFYGGIGCPKTNGSWPMLQIIDLAHNNFIGDLPGASLTSWQAMVANKDDALSKVNHLQFRDDQDATVYYQNEITITHNGLVIELVKILSVFTSIDISCNEFNGSIPEEIGELKSLLFLNLSNNAFTGAIPSSLSNLSQLESLDLSKNNLSGQIPPQLTKLTFLSFLNLSNNQLVGRIPSGNQFSTFSKSSFEGNKNLSGPPLTQDDKTRLSPPALKKSHPNSGDEIDWDIICVEIGFTLGFGIAIGSLLFCKRWRKWYYRAMYNILLKIFPQLEQRFGNHRRHVYINQRY